MPSSRSAYLGQPLSYREIQVVTAIADGLTNAEAGARLALSHLTVKSHLSRIARKLGTGDRAGIVAAAVRSGELDLASPPPARWRVPVVCGCKRCADELAAGQGLAARIAGLQLAERAA